MTKSNVGIKLTYRLSKIAGYVEKGEVVADIGTDHGYIPIYLAQKHIVKRAYAMDINQGPLNKAIDNIKQNKVEKVVLPILSNGLENIAGDVNCIVIAGMGGCLVRDILAKGKDKLIDVDQLILSPHSDVAVVRKYIHEIGYRIDKEDFIKDENKYYHILSCHKGIETYDDPLAYKYGVVLLNSNNRLYQEYLLGVCDKYQLIVEHLKDNQSNSAAKKRKELNGAINEMKEVMAWVR